MKKILLTGILLSLGSLPLAAKDLVLKEPIGSSWQNELIGEEMTFKPGELPETTNLGVVGPEGKAVISQVSEVKKHPDGSVASCKVWFEVDLPAGGSAQFQILPVQKPVSGVGVTVERRKDSAILWTPNKVNGGVQILLGDKTYPEPVVMSGTQAPIQSLILPNGKALGASTVNAPTPLKSWTSEIIDAGPLFVRARIAYEFESGYWNMEVTVRANTPMIEVSEEFNTGDDGQTYKNFDKTFTLALEGNSFQPTQGWFTGIPRGPEYSDLQKITPPSSWTETGGLPDKAAWVAGAISGYTLPRKPNLTEYGLTGWPTNIANIGNFYQVAQPDGFSIGFASLDPMGWRDPMAIRMGTDANGKMQARLPIQKFKQGWNIDGFGGGSPNYTGVTLDVEPNISRRNYGILIATTPAQTGNSLEPVIAAAVAISGDTLDKIRHWTFQWPDKLSPDQLGSQSSPEAEKALAIMRQRRDLHHVAGPYATFSMANHFNYAKRIFPLLEPVVKDPKLTTPEQHQELRSLFAYEAYRQNSDASFPYGSGLHLNNPNMTIMAVEAQARSAGLIPDHPTVPAWRERQLGLMQNFFKRFTFASGVPFENPHYSIGVTYNWAAIANQALMDAGIGDAFDNPLFKKSMEFLPNWLTPPDARFLGHRMLLPIGDGSYQSFPPDFVKYYVEYYKTRDPKLASEIQWAGNVTLPEDQQVKIMPKDTPPDLKSAWWKDYGAAFRHGFGTNYETFMFLLAGKGLGHYENETDQMAYTLYAKGQPINLHFGNGYFPKFVRPWLRNRISFDMKMEAFEHDRIEVENATFQPAADYVRAVREVDLLLDRGAEYPKLDEKGDWSKEEGADFAKMASSDGEKIPLTVWTRQMALLKDPDPAGPNYFILRDSFGGEPTNPTELNLWFLSNGMKKEGDVYHFDGQVNVDMDVFVNTPENPEVTTGRYGHRQEPYRRLVKSDPQYFEDGKQGEYQDLLRISQGPGKDYLVVLYPRLKGKDAPAKFTRLGPETVKVETEFSTDVTFLGSAPQEISTSGWKATGTAFSIRQYKDGRSALVNFEGDCTAQAGAAKVSGKGAFTVTLKDGKATVTEQAEGAEVSVK